MLESQRGLCNEMIREKDQLIDELQQDLKQKDDQYVKDLRKQVSFIDYPTSPQYYIRTKLYPDSQPST